MKAQAAQGFGARLLGDRQMFVIVNVAVNLIFLVRTYVTMRVLDYRGLGLAALLQSVVLLIGAFQLGLLNGGFRLICNADRAEAGRINNLVYTYVGALAGLSLAIGAVLLTLGFRGGDADLVALLGIVGGVLTLVRTWMTNRMVAEGALRRLNGINFLSALLSISALLFVPVNPLIACLAAIAAQPALFVLMTALTDPAQLPCRLEGDLKLVRSVLHAGFILFLTGIFLQLNTMLERWYVSAEIGVDALGHLYLAILFVTLFQLVPTSLDQLYLPAIVRANDAGDRSAVARTLRQFFFVVLLYCAAAALALALAARPLTALILPQYVVDLRYVYLLAPGLILFTLTAPLAMSFNATIRYAAYFWAYGTGTALTAGAYALAAVLSGGLDLDQVVLLRTGVYSLIGLLLAIGYVRLLREFPQFGFALAQPWSKPV